MIGSMTGSKVDGMSDGPADGAIDETRDGMSSGGAIDAREPVIVCVPMDGHDLRRVQGECDALAAHVLDVCRSHGWLIACAESLTGGLLADAFVRIPGASEVFLGSAVTYAVPSKAHVLGVDADLLAREGAVHPEVARQMARGTAALYAASSSHYAGRVIGLSTTGVAGPGPDGDKPAGLAYIGLALPGGAPIACEVRASGDRPQVRRGVVLAVLRELDRGLSAD